MSTLGSMQIPVRMSLPTHACITKNGPEVPVDQPSANWLHSWAILMYGAAFLNLQSHTMATVDLSKPPTLGAQQQAMVTPKAGPWPKAESHLFGDLPFPYPMGLP